MNVFERTRKLFKPFTEWELVGQTNPSLPGPYQLSCNICTGTFFYAYWDGERWFAGGANVTAAVNLYHMDCHLEPLENFRVYWRGLASKPLTDTARLDFVLERRITVEKRDEYFRVNSDGFILYTSDLPDLSTRDVIDEFFRASKPS